MHLTPIAAASTPEWRALRQTGIGASESAAACGWQLGPRVSPSAGASLFTLNHGGLRCSF